MTEIVAIGDETISRLTGMKPILIRMELLLMRMKTLLIGPNEQREEANT
jgi:hypothetical protein